MALAALPDIITKFTELMGEANVESLDSTELLDNEEAAETTGNVYFIDGWKTQTEEDALL